MNDEALDDLLSRWHGWMQGDRGVRGFNKRALVVGDCRGYGLQYESQQEAQDIAADDFRSRQVDHEVRHMDEPYRTAIHQDARNLYTGIAVWSSPRLPRDPVTREIVVQMARLELKGRLLAAGVM